MIRKLRKEIPSFFVIPSVSRCDSASLDELTNRLTFGVRYMLHVLTASFKLVFSQTQAASALIELMLHVDSDVTITILKRFYARPPSSKSPYLSSRG